MQGNAHGSAMKNNSKQCNVINFQKAKKPEKCNNNAILKETV